MAHEKAENETKQTAEGTKQTAEGRLVFFISNDNQV